MRLIFEAHSYTNIWALVWFIPGLSSNFFTHYLYNLWGTLNLIIINELIIIEKIIYGAT